MKTLWTLWKTNVVRMTLSEANNQRLEECILFLINGFQVILTLWFRKPSATWIKKIWISLAINQEWLAFSGIRENSKNSDILVSLIACWRICIYICRTHHYHEIVGLFVDTYNELDYINAFFFAQTVLNFFYGSQSFYRHSISQFKIDFGCTIHQW